MDLDPPSQGLAVPGLPGQGIAVSALPSQELLAKLQLFCEGSLPAPQPTSGHLQVCVQLNHSASSPLWVMSVSPAIIPLTNSIQFIMCFAAPTV